MKKGTCLRCRKKFYHRQVHQDFCSRSCARQHRLESGWRRKQSPEERKKRSLAWRREKNPSWKGGRYKTTAGYICILMPSHPRSTCRGYVFEHTLKVEKKLGRHLRKKERVHHLNSNPSDNRLKNLLLLPSNAAHTALHSKGRFVSKQTRNKMRKAKLGYRKWKGNKCLFCNNEALWKLMCIGCYKRQWRKAHHNPELRKLFGWAFK